MQLLKRTYSQNESEIVLVVNEALNQPKTILIIGSTHGDEPQGKILIENYLDNITEEQEKTFKNRVLFIPCLNPDGFELETRQNSNDIDINRNFPTENWVREPFASEYFGGETPASEIETTFLMEVLEEYKPDVVLTLHAPFKVVNFDGPAKIYADKISEIIGYPVQSDIGYATPGSFGTYAGVERNIPVITLEVDEEIDVKELVKPINEIFEYLINV